MPNHADAPLSPDAATLLAEYCRYAELAEHLRAVPEAADRLGVRDVSPAYQSVLRELEDVVLDRLTRLDALGLYPATTTDVEVTVNGVPIALPELDHDAPTAAPLAQNVPTEGDLMETIPHDHEPDTDSNGLDPSMTAEPDGPRFIERYVAPYVGYLATFTVGAACGVVGARMLGGATDLNA